MIMQNRVHLDDFNDLEVRYKRRCPEYTTDRLLPLLFNYHVPRLKVLYKYGAVISYG